MLKKAFGLGMLAMTFAAYAQEPFFSEMLINPAGTDDTFESIELQGPANFDFSQHNGYYIVIIEGDGSVMGTVDVVIPLTGNTAGANGTFLIRDDSRVLLPAPDPLTNILVMNFQPDIENGSNTYVLGYGDSPQAIGTDLDTDNDGTLDQPLSLGSFTVVDAFGYDDDDSIADGEYATELGGQDFGVLNDGTDLFTPDAYYRVLDSNGNKAEYGFLDVDDRGQVGGPYYIQVESGGQLQHFNLSVLGVDLANFTLDIGTPNLRKQSSTIDVKADAFTIIFGSLSSGGLTDTFDSDDSRMVILNGNTFLITQSPVTVEFTGTSSSMTASKVDFTCEARASLVGLKQRLDMFNYVSNGFVQVDERSGSTGVDEVVTVTKTTDAQEFVDSTTGAVRWRYRLKDDTPAFLASWTAQIDQMIYTIAP